ncbi:hypothetical protein SAMN05446927_6569 [Caballeronia arationis]|jgi:hypothetical protein|uniref:Uncharacterized protein n=1 Tax=Caballeronia arationis TaxID=1777142 RepID=A0A7Z7IC93_9BURK|nr:hypothetical protein [Caballeronia arationis]SOE87980.1 hypothetical protein SAMN05446927_6569 [Caballeronia arationis]
MEIFRLENYREQDLMVDIVRDLGKRDLPNIGVFESTKLRLRDKPAPSLAISPENLHAMVSVDQKTERRISISEVYRTTSPGCWISAATPRAPKRLMNWWSPRRLRSSLGSSSTHSKLVQRSSIRAEVGRVDLSRVPRGRRGSGVLSEALGKVAGCQ